MRLPNIPSNQVTSEQCPLFDKLNTGIRENLQDFTTHKPDGSLIGPFNALLHFPAYGTPVWDLFLALAGNSVLPKAAREVVILATAARFGSLYELYSHEAVAAESGLTTSKIRTIAGNQRHRGPVTSPGCGPRCRLASMSDSLLATTEHRFEGRRASLSGLQSANGRKAYGKQWVTRTISRDQTRIGSECVCFSGEVPGQGSSE